MTSQHTLLDLPMNERCNRPSHVSDNQQGLKQASHLEFSTGFIKMTFVTIDECECSIEAKQRFE
jgi:hypothetical protein